MSTPLHTVEALAEIANNSQGRAAGWAATRLALVAPNLLERLPDFIEFPGAIAALDLPNAVPLLAEALARDPRSDAAREAIGLTLMGCLPEQPQPLINALKRAIEATANDQDALALEYGVVLADLDALDPVTLRRLVSATSFKDFWPYLVAITLRTAGEQARDIGPALAKQVGQIAQEDRARLPSLLRFLGLPAFDLIDAVGSERLTTKQLVDLGLECAMAPPRPLPPHHGSKKRRRAALVRWLLLTHESPIAPFLVELSQHITQGPAADCLLFCAAWLSGFIPSDSVDDVLHRSAGWDTARLSHARRTSRDMPCDTLLNYLTESKHSPIGLLAINALLKPSTDESLAHLFFEQVLAGSLSRGLSYVISVHHSDWVAALIADEGDWAWGLEIAPWCPTEEVLTALLALGPPADPNALTAYVYALSAMGDPAVGPLLNRLTLDQPQFAPHRELFESILQRPLDSFQ